MNTKGNSRRAAKRPAPPRKKTPTVGARIVEGLEQAIAWTRGKNDDIRVTLAQVPAISLPSGTAWPSGTA